MAAPFVRRLHYGDNLQVLREHVPSESVDLVYLDPPFNSKRLYNVYIDEETQTQAFDDTWKWGGEAEADLAFVREEGPPSLDGLLHALRETAGDGTGAYLAMMAARLLELRRVLKPTGSIYLHCDPTASHHLREIMDAVFGRANFRNEIIWKRTSAHSKAKKFGAVHDDLLFYTKSDRYTWNTVHAEYDKKYIDQKYRHEDDDGRLYRLGDLTGPGKSSGDSGKPWKGVDPTAKGRHWAIPRTLLAKECLPDDILDALDMMDSLGRVYWPKEGGVPQLKRYLDEMPGSEASDVITDIPPVNSMAAERLGYPTQKPVALLERIISASSNPGDFVMDPFCGCGTAIEAAEKLGRQWIGIDITHLAIALIESRLADGFGRRGLEWDVTGTPANLPAAEDLAARDKFQFQCWACSLVRARPLGSEFRKGPDGGIDGVILFNDEGPKAKMKRIIVEVKGGKDVGSPMIDKLLGVVVREKAAIGFFVTLYKPTERMETDAAKAGFYVPPCDKSLRIPRLQILHVEKLLEGVPPQFPPDFTSGGGTFRRNRPVFRPVERNSLL
jgi:site-specific DNA-methyltransferase (adenine-specific)